MRRVGVALVLGLLAMSMSSVAAASNRKTVDPKLDVRDHFQFFGGTEVAFSGHYAYVGQMDGHTDRGQLPDQGGVNIYDVSGRTARQVGSVHCPGNDNDVEVVHRGLIALGYATNRCASGQGLLLIDVSDPAHPRMLGHVTVPSSHTITPYPGKSLLYVSPGGLAYAGGPEQVVDVSDPQNPKVVSTFATDQNGCHDFSFHVTANSKLGFCAGESGVFIFDVSNPTKPTLISRIVNPAMQFGHFALASPNGKVLAVNDEAFVAHDCSTGQSPTGAVWFYDISDPATPMPIGHFSPPRGPQMIGSYAGWTGSWCTSHQFDWVSNELLVVPWYAGGVSLIDVTDPKAAHEVASYDPKNTIAYSAQFDESDSQVFVTDLNLGLTILDLKGAH
ncbi:MAG: hypothetical protein M3290_02635 [Actinomycetota bacterium]|nr:hypothetical protein [Actinomycetota bacterium]